jgi:hypothetical protein
MRSVVDRLERMQESVGLIGDDLVLTVPLLGRGIPTELPASNRFIIDPFLLTFQSDASLIALSKQHNLRSLDLSENLMITSHGIQFLAENCHSLVYLGLEGCSQLADCVGMVVQSNPELQQVRFSRCWSITGIGTRWHHQTGSR